MLISTAHPTLRRTLVAATALAATVSLAACGGGGSSAPKDPAAVRADAALKFARCMRAHGIDMPDPTGGMVRLQIQKGDAERAQTAQQACQHFMKQAADTVDPKERAARQDQLLRFAACMRSHGVPMKDPTTDGGIRIGGPGGGPGPDSAVFRAANAKCHMPGGPALRTSGGPGVSGPAAGPAAGASAGFEAAQ
jgi:hypothetical protein